MSGNEEISIKVPRGHKKHSGFLAEQRDDGFYYLSSIPSKCRDANIYDQIREINGIRWDEFEDEDHINEVLDDPKLKYIRMSIVPMDVEEDSESAFSASEGSDESGNVSIETDADEEYSKVDSVINQAPSVAERPTGRRKIVEEYNTDEDLDSLEEEIDEDDSETSTAQGEEQSEDDESLEDRRGPRRRTQIENASDASDGDQDFCDEENEAYDQQTGRYDDEDEENELVDSDEDYEETDSERREREAFEEAQLAKQLERERARAIKERKEEQRKQEEQERRRKEELARLRKEAEAQGQKMTKAKVKVERNIGAYTLGNSKRPSNGSKPSTDGWSKVKTNPKPSSGGWSKVSANHKN